jgi:hypothetical protein
LELFNVFGESSGLTRTWHGGAAAAASAMVTEAEGSARAMPGASDANVA